MPDAHEHEWFDLGTRNIKVDIVRRSLVMRGVRSFYEVVEVCRVCHSGRTRDGLVFEDLRQTIIIEDEARSVRETGSLRLLDRKK